MRRGYGQYCPLALAAELLCERWTLLIVSRLLDGCRGFNAIHRGVPRISPSLLSARLAQLERAGLVARRRGRKGTASEYLPTAAARELDSIIMDIAVWGQRWSRDMTTDDLDPAFLLWSMHVSLDTSTMPPGRTVLEFEFTGAPSDCRRFWLVHENGTVDMCLKNPGYEADLRIESDLKLFTEAWRGIRDLKDEIRARRVRVIGPTELRRSFPGWLKLSQLAPYARLRAGREQRMMAVRRPRVTSVSSESTARQPTPATHPE